MVHKTKKDTKTNRIPMSEFLVAPEDMFTYVTMDMIRKYHTVDEQKNFDKWMRGQTMSDVNGVTAIYSWDYERWVIQGKKTEQGADWD